MDIIKERNRRTKDRKFAKEKIDKAISLNLDNEKQYLNVKPNEIKLEATEGKYIETQVRLLDEGTITYGDGSPYFYIARGTLQKYLNALPDNMEGSINIGHSNMTERPDLIVGKWKKEDLSLVDIGDGRLSLFCNMKVLRDHPSIKALQMSCELGVGDVGVSAELLCGYSEEMSLQASKEYSKAFGQDIYFGVVDTITMGAFAIVGECGNVNSDGVRLNMNIDELKLEIETSKAELEKANAEIEELKKELSEEPKEEVQDEEVQDEEPKEEVQDEEVLSVLNELKENQAKLQAEIEELKAENTKLNEENEKLGSENKKLGSANKQFKDNILNLNVSHGTKTEGYKAQYTNGIGVL